MKTDHRGMYAQEMSGGEKKAELTGELQYRHGKSGAAGRRATHPQARRAWHSLVPLGPFEPSHN